MPTKKKGEGTPRGASERVNEEAPDRASERDAGADAGAHPAPHELYRREKARRARAATHSAGTGPLEEARREYKALLAADAARGKGGRPRKNAAPPATAAAAAPADDDPLADEVEDAVAPGDADELESVEESEAPEPDA